MTLSRTVQLNAAYQQAVRYLEKTTSASSDVSEGLVRDWEHSVLAAWWEAAVCERTLLQRTSVLHRLLGTPHEFADEASQRRTFFTRWTLCILITVREFGKHIPLYFKGRSRRVEQIADLAMSFCPLQSVALRDTARAYRLASAVGGEQSSSCSAVSTVPSTAPSLHRESPHPTKNKLRLLSRLAESANAHKHSNYRITRQDFDPEEAWEHVTRCVQQSTNPLAVTDGRMFNPPINRRLLSSEAGRMWVVCGRDAALSCERAVYTACSLLGGSHFPTFYSFLPFLFDLLRYVDLFPSTQLVAQLRIATIRYLTLQADVISSLGNVSNHNGGRDERTRVDPKKPFRKGQPSEMLIRFLAEIFEPLAQVCDRVVVVGTSSTGSKQDSSSDMTGEQQLTRTVLSAALTEFGKMSHARRTAAPHQQYGRLIGCDSVFLERYVAQHSSISERDRIFLHAQLCLQR